jgi:signal transduction histidine kinase
MSPASAWSTHQLAEFLEVVSSFETESSAALGAVERAAEALDAEVGAIVSGGTLVAAVGYPDGAAPVADLESVARGLSHELAVPGVGICPATGVPLEHPPHATLIVARSGADGLSVEEAGVLRGMARVTSMTMRMLRLLDEERTAREEGQRQAAENERLANQQAALQRVATLVAHGVPPEEVFAAVAEEVCLIAPTDMAHIYRYEPDGTAVAVAVWSNRPEKMQVGTRYPAGGHNVPATVLRTGRAARIDDTAQITGSLAPIVRRLGVRSAVGSPIVVEGRLWGVMVAGTAKPQPVPADTEQRIAGFAELAATAISNAQARVELARSRARVVAAADEERQRVVRDLHDGAQQRLVHAIIGLKAAREALENGDDEALDLVRKTLDQAEQANAELRELAHGILPSVLVRGGLRAGVESLVSRSSLPVTVDVCQDRFPPPIEATAYFVVSEALTNVVKHSGARSAEVRAHIGDGVLGIEVSDDGVGGADLVRGTGLIGLGDRLAALDGRLRIESPPGGGTLVGAALPLPA